MKHNKQKLKECVERMNDETQIKYMHNIQSKRRSIQYRRPNKKWSSMMDLFIYIRNGQILDDGPSPCSERIIGLFSVSVDTPLYRGLQMWDVLCITNVMEPIYVTFESEYWPLQ